MHDGCGVCKLAKSEGNFMYLKITLAIQKTLLHINHHSPTGMYLKIVLAIQKTLLHIIITLPQGGYLIRSKHF
jgi:hypothetical protein